MDLFLQQWTGLVAELDKLPLDEAGRKMRGLVLLGFEVGVLFEQEHPAKTPRRGLPFQGF